MKVFADKSLLDNNLFHEFKMLLSSSSRTKILILNLDHL